MNINSLIINPLIFTIKLRTSFTDKSTSGHSTFLGTVSKLAEIFSTELPMKFPQVKQNKLINITSAHVANKLRTAYLSGFGFYLFSFAKAIGSLEIIGNPYKHLTEVAKGFSMFTEPFEARSFEEAVRAGAQGTKEATVGIASTTAKYIGGIGNQVSKQAAKLTFNEDFQTDLVKKQQQQNRSVSKAIGGGLLKTFAAVPESIIEVGKKPIDGAKKGGALGLFKGIGQGVSGLLAKPLVAGVQGISDVMSAVGHKLDPNFQLIYKSRFDRFLDTRNADRILTYDEYAAKGSMILKLVKIDSVDYDSGDYIGHLCVTSSPVRDIDQAFETVLPDYDPTCTFLSIPGDLTVTKMSHCLMLTENYIFALQADDLPESVAWMENWVFSKSEIKDVSYENFLKILN